MLYLCRHWTENFTACVLGCKLVGVASTYLASRVIVYPSASSLYSYLNRTDTFTMCALGCKLIGVATD
jgi:hypothetical protein